MADDAVNGSEIPAGAMDAVREFLRHTVDEPDEEKARALLTAASLAGATYEVPAEWAGGMYAIGDPSVDDDQVWVVVEIENGDEKLQVPFAPVQEAGAWKLDMGKTMEKLMGGMMSNAVGQMASVVGEMMAGVGEVLGDVGGAVGSALSSVLGAGADDGDGEEAKEKGETRKPEAAPQTIVKPAKKAATPKAPAVVKKKPAAKKPLLKKPVAKKQMKPAKKAAKAKQAKPIKKAKAAKKAKPVKKAKPAKMAKKRK